MRRCAPRTPTVRNVDAAVRTPKRVVRRVRDGRVAPMAMVERRDRRPPGKSRRMPTQCCGSLRNIDCRLRPSRTACRHRACHRGRRRQHRQRVDGKAGRRRADRDVLQRAGPRPEPACTCDSRGQARAGSTQDPPRADLTCTRPCRREARLRIPSLGHGLANCQMHGHRRANFDRGSGLLPERTPALNVGDIAT